MHANAIVQSGSNPAICRRHSLHFCQLHACNVRDGLRMTMTMTIMIMIMIIIKDTHTHIESTPRTFFLN